jgi:hypothetical protein
VKGPHRSSSESDGSVVAGKPGGEDSTSEGDESEEAREVAGRQEMPKRPGTKRLSSAAPAPAGQSSVLATAQRQRQEQQALAIVRRQAAEKQQAQEARLALAQQVQRLRQQHEEGAAAVYRMVAEAITGRNAAGPPPSPVNHFIIPKLPEQAQRSAATNVPSSR